ASGCLNDRLLLEVLRGILHCAQPAPSKAQPLKTLSGHPERRGLGASAMNTQRPACQRVLQSAPGQPQTKHCPQVSSRS
uniref:Uncharacterized protein n=1 Tax=Lepisosteus oculatus TaxID=7918 RepID=W5MCM9_LEPOC